MLMADPVEEAAEAQRVAKERAVIATTAAVAACPWGSAPKALQPKAAAGVTVVVALAVRAHAALTQ